MADSSDEVTPTHRLSNILQMQPDRLGIVEVTGLDDDHRITVEFEHPPDQLVTLGSLGVAVQCPAHPIEIHRHLRRLVEPVRFGG